VNGNTVSGPSDWSGFGEFTHGVDNGPRQLFAVDPERRLTRHDERHRDAAAREVHRDPLPGADIGHDRSRDQNWIEINYGRQFKAGSDDILASRFRIRTRRSRSRTSRRTRARSTRSRARSPAPPRQTGPDHRRTSRGPARTASNSTCSSTRPCHRAPCGVSSSARSARAAPWETSFRPPCGLALSPISGTRQRARIGSWSTTRASSIRAHRVGSASSKGGRIRGCGS